MNSSKRDPGFGFSEPETDVATAGGGAAAEATRPASAAAASPAVDGGRAPGSQEPGVAPLSHGEPEGSEGREGPAVAVGPEADGPEAERQLEEDVAVQAGKADEYLELAKRTKADFENYRKRATREMGLAEARGVTKLARELLPAVDNLDRALTAAQASGPEGSSEGVDATLVSGIQLVHADVIAALARVGIEPFSPTGEQFDPQHHEAVAQQPVEGVTSGTIVEVYQRGYRLGENVLRPARVVVAG